jgi:hypothetical protein
MRLSAERLAMSWDEIIAHALMVKSRGGSWSIARHELKAAIPNEWRDMGVKDPVEALNRVLAGNGLIAILECGMVTVIKDGRAP